MNSKQRRHARRALMRGTDPANDAPAVPRAVAVPPETPKQNPLLPSTTKPGAATPTDVVPTDTSPSDRSAPMADAPDTLPMTWNQIAKYGDFSGHEAGPFVFDEAVFQTIIRNFYATANRSVPIDYEHGTEQTDPGSSIYQAGAPAVAFVREIQSREDGGLWGLFEWVDPAAVQYVRQGRYKFFSPAVVFDATDPASGEAIGAKLVSGGLTNRPFLDGMEPLQARKRDGVTVMTCPAVALSLPPQSVHIDGAIKNVNAAMPERQVPDYSNNPATPSQGMPPQLPPKTPGATPMPSADVNQDGQINKVMARIRQALKSAARRKMDDASLDADDIDAATMDVNDTGDATGMDDASLKDPYRGVDVPPNQRTMDDASMASSYDAATMDDGFSMDDVDSMDDGALMDALDMLAKRFRRMDDASLASRRKAAMDDVSMRVRAKVIANTAPAKRAAYSMRVRDPKGFAALFPLPKREAPKPPTRDERLAVMRDAAQKAGLSEEQMTIMTESIAPKPRPGADSANQPANRVEPTAAPSAKTESDDDKRMVRAATLMRENASLSHGDALALAGRQIRDEKLNAAINKVTAGA